MKIRGPSNEPRPAGTATAGTSDVKKGKDAVGLEANVVEDDHGADVLSLHR